MIYKTILSIIVIVAVGVALWFWPTKLPDQVLLSVPFTPQAPTGNWDRNEDCEETSITMANAFLNGITVAELPAGDALNAINQLKGWENVNIGYNKDTGADSTTRLAEGAFKIKVRQIKDFTAEDIKKALAKNQVVLLPHDARLLNNPKYAANGPDYHMLVIRGYTGSTFVVNDPGTSSGMANEYSFETLRTAAADWNQQTQSIENNRKIILVLSK